MTANTANNETNDKPKSKKSLLSEGMLIAAFTLASYSAAYCFEWGYATYFHLPTELIRVSLDMCLRAAANIFIFFAIVLLFSGFTVSMFGNKLDTSERSGKLLLFYSTAASVLFTVFKFGLGWPSYSGAIFWLIIAVIVLSGVVHRYYSDEKKPLADHIVAVVDREPRVLLLTMIEEAVGRIPSMVMYGAVAALIFAFYAGSFTGRVTTSFLITKAGDKILLRNYGDVYVFKNFDKATNTIGNKVKVMGLDKVSELDLQKVLIKKPTIADDLDLAKNDTIADQKNTPNPAPQLPKKDVDPVTKSTATSQLPPASPAAKATPTPQLPKKEVKPAPQTSPTPPSPPVTPAAKDNPAPKIPPVTPDPKITPQPTNPKKK